MAEFARYKPNKVFFHKLLVRPASHGVVQFVRYGLVAIVAFAVDFGLLYVFTSKLHIFYVLSATLAFGLSVIVNYILSVSWAFAQRTDRERHAEIVLFIAICLVALGLNDLFIWVFTSVFGIYYLVSKLITVAIVFFWSFGARRFLFHSALSKKLLRI